MQSPDIRPQENRDFVARCEHVLMTFCTSVVKERLMRELYHKSANAEYVFAVRFKDE